VIAKRGENCIPPLPCDGTKVGNVGHDGGIHEHFQRAANNTRQLIHMEMLAMTGESMSIFSGPLTIRAN
jgi:hypothetical protein